MLDRTIDAKPTIYAGVRFRSRLEAKWAQFFDTIELKWEYEPCRLDGWVPDFLVAGWWLAEVKPVPLTSMAITREAEIQKAIRGHDTLLLGDGPGDALGVLVRRIGGEVFSRYLVANIEKTPAELVPVPFMIPGYNFGLADIWNNMQPVYGNWKVSMRGEKIIKHLTDDE